MTGTIIMILEIINKNDNNYCIRQDTKTKAKK